MRVLIIGAGGQIGSELALAIEAKGWTAWMVDHRPLPKVAGRAALEQAFEQHPGLRERWIAPDNGADATDAGQMAAVFNKVQPDLVFHLAAILSATGEAQPALAWDVNVGSLRVTLEAMTRYRREDGQPPTLICPSSIAAYGPVSGQPEILEQGPVAGPLEPTTLYGVTKVVAERLGAWYALHMAETEWRGRVDFRSLRFPGLLSAVPPGGGSSDYANEMFFAAAAGRSEVEVFVRPDARIPFMYMPDALRALIELASAEAGRLTRRTYNIAACSPSAAELAASIDGQVSQAFSVSYAPDHRQAYVDSWPRRLDDRAARADWGWRPEYDLDAMTAALLRDCREALL